VTISQLTEIKGLEFQHAFLFIGQALFRDLQEGFSGSGQATYHRRRLLRIPFSRAKDSLVTFVMAR
jgi:superfamily I DNA/RNA helicase